MTITVTIASDATVNTTTGNSQYEPIIATLAGGGYVVTWTSTEGGSTEIRGRIFNADGTPVTVNDFLINTTTANAQVLPSVIGLSDGRFAVAWASQEPVGVDYDIRGRIFNADGTPYTVSGSSNDFAINSTTSSMQLTPSVTALNSGRFVVTWHSYEVGGPPTDNYDIRGRLYNADGTASGSDFIINTTTANEQAGSTVTTLADGRFVVTWHSVEGSNYQIRARVFNADGTPYSVSGSTADFVVNTTSANNQLIPAVAALEGGGFVITWYSNDGSDPNDVRARVFNADGTASSANDFLVHTVTAGDQKAPSVAPRDGGGFLILWQSVNGEDGSGAAIMARAFDSSGAAEGSEFVVNTTTAGDQDAPAATLQSNGKIPTTFVSAENSGDIRSTFITINEVPTLTATAAPVDSTNEDTQVEITFAEIAAQGDEADVDGTVVAFVVQAVTSGTLLIGTDAGSATAFAVGTNDTIDATKNAYWTPALNANGAPGAFTVVAKDNAGDVSATPVQVDVSVTALNDAPVATMGGNYTVTEQVAFDIKNTGLSVSDVDAGSAVVTAKLISAGGNINVTAGGSGANVTDSGTGTVTITGTLAEINALLNTDLTSTVSFVSIGDNPSNTSLTLQINDGGNTGTGGILTANDVRSVTVNAVNDAPTATITPPTYSATEQVNLSLKNNGLSVNDVDGNVAATFTLSVLEGILTVTEGDSGVTIDSGNGTSSVVVSGTIAQLNTLLGAGGTSTLVYNDNTDTPSASTTLTLSISDNGNIGGGNQTAQDTATINITALNDAPVATMGGNYTVTEQVAFDIKNTGLSVSDVDAGSAIVTAKLISAGGNINVTAGGSGATVTDSGTGTVTITGTLAQINSLLNTDGTSTVNFVSISDDPSNTSLTLQIDDGGATGTGGILTASDVRSVTITPVNDAPTLTANPANANFTEGAGSSQGTAVAVFTSADVNAIEAAQGILSLTFTVSGLHDGANEKILIDGSTIALTNGANGTTLTNGLSYTVTVVGNALVGQTATVTLTDGTPGTPVSQSAFETLVNGIQYQNTNIDAPTAGARVFKLTQVQDNGGTGSGGDDDATLNVSSTVGVIALNDTPVNTVPGSTVSAQEDTAISITGISVADVDASPQNVQVTLHVDHGILDVNTSVAGGVGAVQVAGDTTGTVVLTGTTAQINNTLADANGLKYLGNLNYDGADTLTVTTNDLGHTGTGGALSDIDTRPITVANVTANTLSAFQSTVLASAPGSDVDGDGQIDPGDTVTTTVQITNNSASTTALNVTLTDVLNGMTDVVGEVNVTPRALDDSYNTIGNTLLEVGNATAQTGPQASVSGSVLTNDSDFFLDTFVISAVNGTAATPGTMTFATANGGSVTFITDDADRGSFSYTPAVNFSGTDTFTYTITDDGLDNNAATTGDNLSNTGTVSINVSATQVWYVDDNAAPGGDGSSSNPFDSLSDVTGATGPDGTGDIIYVAEGTYTGGIVLLDGQTLHGAGTALVVNGITLAAAGTDPTITNAGGNGVTLANGNTLTGFTVGDTTGFDISNAGATVGTLNISNVVLNGTGGLFRADNGGTLNVTFDSASTTSASGNGIHLAGTTSGTFTVGGTGTISGVAGTDVLIGGSSSATVNIASNISSNAGGSIEVTGHTGASGVTFSGDLNITGGTGISVHDNTGSATIAFTNADADAQVINTGASTAISLVNNTGLTINFTGGGLDIDTTSGAGFVASGGGTINISGSGNSINTTTGQILNWSGVNVGSAGNVAFATLGSSGNVANTAISFNNVDGSGTFSGGNVTVAQTTGASADGIRIDGGSAATFNFASATIGSGTNNVIGGDGIELNGANGAVTFTTVSINGVTESGLDTTGNTNAININGGSIGGTVAGTNDPGGNAVDVNAGSGNVTVAASITKNTSGGDVVEVTGRTGGTVAFSGAISASGGSGGIDIDANTGGIINFTGQTALSTGAGTGVDLTNNTGATINFNAGGSGLDITTTSGIGFNATGGGTVTVVDADGAGSQGNSISSTNATALNVVNTTIGASGLTFQSISSGNNDAGADPVNGIVLNSTGAAGGLTVTGTGGGSNNGSGGTIQNTTGSGILLTNAAQVDLGYMNIQNANEDGIEGSSVTGLNLTRLNVTNNGDDSEDVGIGIDNLSGSATWSNLAVTASELANVMVHNTSGTLSSFNIVGGDYSDLGTAFGGNSILIEITGNAVLTSGGVDGATIQDNKPARGITVQAQESGHIGDASGNAFVVQNSTFTNNGLHASFEQSANIAGATGTLYFKFLNNGTAANPMTMPNTPVGTSSAVNVFSSSQTVGGLIVGTIQDNHIGNPAVAGSGSAIGNGLRVFIQGLTDSSLLIDHNFIYQTPQARGIDIQYVGPTTNAGSVTHDLTLTNNTVTPNDSTGFPASAISVSADNQSGSFASAPVVRADIRGNTVPSGTAFDLTTGFLQFFEYDGDGTPNEAADGIGQLVDTGPASANADAQLASTNTGSVGSVGIQLISGPINVPPASLLAASGGVEAATPDAPQWQVAGIGDFNADGLADALVLRTDGLLGVATINGDPATQSHILGQLQTGWQIAAVGDVNNDGTSDILLSNDDGTYQADLIQNNAIAATVDLALVDGQWQVIDPSAPDAAPSDPVDTTPPVVPATDPGAQTPPTTAHPVIVDDGVLTQAELDYIVDAAILRWTATGLTDAQVAALKAMHFSVADMSGFYLGSFAPGAITLDSDAASRGWFLDGTPLEDSEFGHALSATRMETDPSGAPAGHYDLLTTVMHEMGHALGLEDSYADADRNDLMFGYLYMGERRIAGTGEADGAVAGSITSEEFLASPINIGTLRPGETVTVQWNATVNGQTNQLIQNPSNQGSVTSSNFAATTTNVSVTTLDTLVLGDRVFLSANNAVFDPGEGVDGVALTLFADTGTTAGVFDAGDVQLATTTTAGGGLYSFVGLAPGDYIVRVDQSNFNVGGVLHDGTQAALSLAGQPDPDDPAGAGIDNDDNGAEFAGQGVVSLPITLAYNTETTAGTGNDTNNTLDFGFFFVPPNAAPEVTAGSTVGFSEANGNPVALETGLVVEDDDADLIQSATVRITNFFTGDELTFTPFAGITGAYNPLTGVLTFSGGSSTANYQTLLRSVAFDTASNNPNGQPTPGAHTPRNITWTVSDGAQDNAVAASTTVNITTENDAPSVTAATLAAVAEDTAAPVGATVASLFAGHFSDPDNANETITGIAVSANAATASEGVWQYFDGSWNNISTAVSTSSALALSAATQIRFLPVADFNGMPGSLTAYGLDGSYAGTFGGPIDTTTNGGITPISGGAATISTSVTAVNDAPVLNAGPSPVLAAINEDLGAPVNGSTANSTLVSSLVDIGGALSNVTDIDTGAVTGIALTGTSGAGTWHYSINGGATWNTVGAVADGAARLLAAGANTRLYYQPGANETGTIGAAITFRAWDQTAGGANGADGVNTVPNGATTAFSSLTDTAAITINSAADTPNATDATTLEDTLSTAGLVITKNAADGPDVTHFKVTNIQHGQLFLNDGTTEVFNDTFLSFTDPLVSAGLRFLPAQNFNNTDALGSFDAQASAGASDLGLGGAVVTATIDVTPVNDEPSFIKGPDQIVVLNAGPQTVVSWAPGILPGPPNELGQTVTFTLTNDNNALFSSQPAIDPSGSLTYTPAAGASGLATVQVTLMDNGGTANGGDDTAPTQTFTIIVNAPPEIDLDGPGGPTGFASTFTENGAAIPIVDTDIVVEDDNDTQLQSATVVLTNAQVGDTLTVGNLSSFGITSVIDTSVAGQITVLLSGTSSLANYASALKQIFFENSSESPATVNRNLSVTVNDGLLPSNSAITALTVVSLNDAPINTVPGTQNVEANHNLAIPGLAINDVDAGAGAVTTTLSVAHGTLAVASAGGAAVGGSGTGTVTLTGTVAQINTTLAAAGNVLYTPTHDFFGADTLTVVTNDDGNTGNVGPLSDTDNVVINVNTLVTGTSSPDDFVALTGNSRVDGLGGTDKITFNFRLVDAIVTYEGNRVVIDSASSHTVTTGLETFVFTDGTVNNNDGNPLVDDLFYYSKYHDVWSAGVDADAHYNTSGWHENRDPNAFFSTNIYLSSNADVKAAGVNPLDHFHTSGWHEGRVPSLKFDPRQYLDANPDVAAAHIDPLFHFLLDGAEEGRQPFAPSELVALNGFDFVYYLANNPDVAAANVDPLQHFITFGWQEGRNPNALFNTNAYLAAYPDVDAANINPFVHYDQFGWHEGRDPSVGFDTTSYLAAYPDVAAANVNPLTHFLKFGIHEGRSSFADGIFG